MGKFPVNKTDHLKNIDKDGKRVNRTKKYRSRKKAQWKERNAMNYFYLAAGARPTNVAQLSGDKDGKTEIGFQIGKDSTPDPA